MIEIVKVPKYVCDVSDNISWLPKRFQEGSMIAQAYCIHNWYDGYGVDAGMQWKGYRNWKMLIFQRGELGEMDGTKSRACREHRRTLENAQDEILHNRHGDRDRMQKVECHHCGGMYFNVSRTERSAESYGVSRVECDRGLSEFQRLVLERQRSESEWVSPNNCTLIK